MKEVIFLGLMLQTCVLTPFLEFDLDYVKPFNSSRIISFGLLNWFKRSSITDSWTYLSLAFGDDI